MSKHAYLIIAHNLLHQLEFLLKLLDDPRNDIYILIDKKTSIPSSINFTLEKSKTTLIHDVEVNWGEYSQITAEMVLFKSSFEHGPYKYYHLISGQDLPLYNQDYIHNFFDNNPNKIFLTIPGKKIYNNAHILNRVKYNYKFINLYGKSSNSNRIIKKIFRILEKANMMLQNFNGSAKRKANTLPDIKYASNWLTLNNEAIEYLLKNTNKIKEIFKNSFLCDELFVPTILLNNPKFNKMLYSSKTINDNPDDFQGNMRYINWWDGSPYVWTDQDLDKIKYGMKLGHLFSRKFDLEKSPKLKDFISKQCS